MGEAARAAERLIATVGRFAGRRIAVLADLGVDEFVHGDIERVSREAPVLILRQNRTVVVPGGGGNAVANLRALGAEPVPVGVVGRDDAGRRLLGALREIGVATDAVVAAAGYATPAKSRIIAGGVHTRRQQVVRLDRGAERGDLPPALRRRIAAALRSALRDCAGLVVADYGYGAATPEAVQGVLRRRRSGFPVTVDSRGRVGSYRGVAACTPNHEELEQAAGRPLTTEAMVEAAARHLLRRSRAGAVLLTRGARGMTLFERRRPSWSVEAFGAGDVADVTGAGDTVVAAFSLSLLAGATLRDAVRLANYAAGLVVMKYGTATVGPAELIAAVREDLA